MSQPGNGHIRVTGASKNSEVPFGIEGKPKGNRDLLAPLRDTHTAYPNSLLPGDGLEVRMPLELHLIEIGDPYHDSDSSSP